MRDMKTCGMQGGRDKHPVGSERLTEWGLEVDVAYEPLKKTEVSCDKRFGLSARCFNHLLHHQTVTNTIVMFDKESRSFFFTHEF